MLPNKIKVLGEILTLKEVHTTNTTNPYAIYINEDEEESYAWLTMDGETIIQVD